MSASVLPLLLMPASVPPLESRKGHPTRAKAKIQPCMAAKAPPKLSPSGYEDATQSTYAPQDTLWTLQSSPTCPAVREMVNGPQRQSDARKGGNGGKIQAI